MRKELQDRLRRLEPYLPLCLDHKDLLDIAEKQTGLDRDTLFSWGRGHDYYDMSN